MVSLTRLDVLLGFSTIFARGTILWLSVCLLKIQSTAEEVSTLKGKNLLPLRANSFPLKYIIFQKGGNAILRDLPPLKVYPFLLSELGTLGIISTICFTKNTKFSTFYLPFCTPRPFLKRIYSKNALKWDRCAKKTKGGHNIYSPCKSG